MRECPPPILSRSPRRSRACHNAAAEDRRPVPAPAPRPDTTRLQPLVHSYRDPAPPLQRVLHSYRGSAALMAAVELGLFTRVAEGADTEAAVARALDLTPTNAERLGTAGLGAGL